MSDDALQAAADMTAEELSDLSIRQHAVKTWLESPDVAGCDCDDGYRAPQPGQAGYSEWLEDGGTRYNNCPRCVVVQVPDKDGIRVRVRKTAMAEWGPAVRLPVVGVETDD